jgi:hypothetical protein
VERKLDYMVEDALAAETIHAVLPDRSDGRAIYTYHAGVAPTDRLDTTAPGVPTLTI